MWLTANDLSAFLDLLSFCFGDIVVLCPQQDCVRRTGGQRHHCTGTGSPSPNGANGLLLGKGKTAGSVNSGHCLAKLAVSIGTQQAHINSSRVRIDVVYRVDGGLYKTHDQHHNLGRGLSGDCVPKWL